MSKTTVMWLSLIDRPVAPPVCEALDEDCAGVQSYTRCWLHAPEKGACPFLRPDSNRDGVHPT